MGEIVIKIPEEVKEVIELNVPYEKLKMRLKELEREEKAKYMLNFLNKYKGTVKIEPYSEEELHLQENE